MKKFFFLTVLAMLTFVACKKDAASTQSSLNATNKSKSQSAGPQNDNTPFTFDFTGSELTNYCTGQTMVAAQGTGHWIALYGGTQAHLQLSFDNVVCQAIDGTGPLYRGTGSPGIIDIPNQTQGIRSYSINVDLRLTTAGADNNSLMHFIILVVVNGNNITTVNIDKLWVGCQ